MPNHTPLKRCAICGVEKPLDAFHKNRSKSFGCDSRCKYCKSISTGHTPKVKPGPAKICKSCGKELPNTFDYFRRDSSQRPPGQPCLECYRAKRAIRREIYREQDRARAREVYKNNPQLFRERTKNFRNKNPEKVKTYDRQKHLNNPSLRRLIGIRYETRKRGLPDDFSVADWQCALDFFKGCCAVCGRPPGLWHTLAADHWIPLSSPDCPGTVPTNIIPLCHGTNGCNNQKNQSDPTQWLIKKLGSKKAKRKLAEIQSYFDSLRETHE